MPIGGCLEAGKARADRIQGIGKIAPGRRDAGAGAIDSPARVPAADGMLRFENLLMVHAGEEIIALVEFADMIEAEPAIFAGAVVATAAAINWRCAEFAAFCTAFNRAGPALGLDAAVKAVRFSFGGSFSQIPFGLGLSKPGCPLC